MFNLEGAIDPRPMKRLPAQNKFNCGPDWRTHIENALFINVKVCGQQWQHARQQQHQHDYNT
jgi:hypothetical protein